MTDLEAYALENRDPEILAIESGAEMGYSL